MHDKESFHKRKFKRDTLSNQDNDAFGGGQKTNNTGYDRHDSADARAKSFGSDQSNDKFKKCYLFGLFMTISIGTLQFGFSIGSWNTGFKPYSVNHGWTDDAQLNQLIVQSITTAGSAIGAIFSGPFAKYGRWKCIILCNVFIIVGSALCILADQLKAGIGADGKRDMTMYYLSLTILNIGRFLYGLACGAYSVFCPKYIAETAPVEIKGPAGFLTQICVTLGILIPFSISLIFPNQKEISDIGENERTILLWILFTIPACLGILQTVLMFFIFNYDTPPMLYKNEKTVQLHKFMAKIYHPYLVQERIQEIGGNNLISIVGGIADNDAEINVGYKRAFSDAHYFKASLVGCALASFQILTGINFLFFYSNTLFGKIEDFPVEYISFTMSTVNFIATLFGLSLSFKFGRKTLMFIGNAVMTILLALVGVFSMLEWNNAMLICVMVFIIAFECSSGPIVWLYMAETMQDKAVSIATGLNWIMNLLVSIITPLIIPSESADPAKKQTNTVPYIFISCAVLTAFATVFIAIFMIETKGKTLQEIEKMNYVEKRFKGKKLQRQITEGANNPRHSLQSDMDDYEQN